MDLWKWVAVAAAAAVSVLVYFGVLNTPLQRPTGATGQRTVVGGTFIINQAGARLGQEDFLMSAMGSTRDLHSTVTLDGQNNSQRFNQRLRLTQDLKPVRYFRDTAAQNTETVLVEIDADQVHFNVFYQGQAQERDDTVQAPYVVLDGNVFSHYLLLFEFINTYAAAGRAFEATAIVPQTMMTFPLTVDQQVTASLRHEGRLLPVQQWTISLGSKQVTLYSQGDTLVGVALPDQRIFAYRSDLFEAGLEEVK